MAAHVPNLTPDLESKSVATSFSEAPDLGLAKFANKLIAPILDYVCVFIGTLFGLFCYQLIHGAPWSGAENLLFALTIQYWLFFAFMCRICGLYSQSPALLHVQDTAQVLKISCYCLIALSAEIYIGRLTVPRITLCVGWVVTVFLLLLQKHFSRWAFVRIVSARRPQRPVLIVGASRDARRIFSCLSNSPHLGLRPVAFIDEVNSRGPKVIYSHDYVHKSHAPIIYEPLSLDLCRDMGISEIFIADPKLTHDRISDLTTLATTNNMKVSFVGPAQPIRSERHASMRLIDGLIVLSYASTKLEWRLYEVLKRLFDIVVASLMLLMTAPIWVAIALWVWRTSPGPIFFCQRRIGHHGKSFNMYKFRSMYVDAPRYSASPINSQDPRITPAGRILRKTSLDELPQILNVLKGDMSLVGPRPEMPYVVEKYSPIERQRLNVPQGVTGIWQLSADRKYAIHESLEYDLYYIENRGFFLDTAILIHTILFAMKGA